eukprot:g7003.t1
MATVFTSTKAVTPVAPKTVTASPSLKPSIVHRNPFHARTVSNGSRVRQIMTWIPYNNKFFETLSYLPPLTSDQIARQVDYMVANGWVPCLEFADPDYAYVQSTECGRFGPVSSGYQDNRYWTMWKLPMFGCTEASSVLSEISACERTFPNSYIRIAAFDSVRQVQIAGFLVHRPLNARDYIKDTERRSTA